RPEFALRAVQAKKHVTVFMRSPSAPGAGRPEVKAAFTACAAETLGIEKRSDRNVKLKSCMEARGLKTGVFHKKSRARVGSPLFGRVYTYGAGVPAPA
ncbi:unnamed protein product, partial [marine sediment metagenome]